VSQIVLVSPGSKYIAIQTVALLEFEIPLEGAERRDVRMSPRVNILSPKVCQVSFIFRPFAYKK